MCGLLFARHMTHRHVSYQLYHWCWLLHLSIFHIPYARDMNATVDGWDLGDLMGDARRRGTAGTTTTGASGAPATFASLVE